MFNKKEYDRIGETVYYDTLPNGLKLAVVMKPGFRHKMAFLAVNYGSADTRFELDGEKTVTPAGTAHFLEHKMFESQDGSDAMAVFSLRGANSNAFTSSEMTAFHFDCTDNFYENLDTLVHLVLEPAFTEESVEKEKSIIAQEIVMGEDDPDQALYYGLLRCLFKRHPIREPVVGTVKSIEGITADLLYKCHKAFYVPSNMELVICGDVDPIKVRQRVMKLMPEGYTAPPKRTYPKESDMPDKDEVSRVMDVAAPLFIAGAKTEPALRGASGIRHELLASLSMGTLMGDASELYSRLYDDGIINETFGFDFECCNGVSFISFGGETDEPDRVVNEVMQEAKKLSERGLDGEFFRRRKRSTLGDELRGLSSFDSICYNVAAAMEAGYDFFECVPILQGITEDDVRAFLAKYVVPSRFAISMITERKGEE